MVGNGPGTQHKETGMQDGRIATLEQRHSRLDRRIDSESNRAGSDDMELARMKRERLSLKDQLAGISSSA